MSTTMRVETDSLGELAVPADALYGIHTTRALVNFPLTGRPCAPSLIRGMAQVKLACTQTNLALGYLDARVGEAIVAACLELIDDTGRLIDAVVVDALQGGHGLAVIGLAQVDKAHVRAVQVRVQFCLLGVPGRQAQVAQLRVGGGHFLSSQPTW